MCDALARGVTPVLSAGSCYLRKNMEMFCVSYQRLKQPLKVDVKTSIC